MDQTLYQVYYITSTISGLPIEYPLMHLAHYCKSKCFPFIVCKSFKLFNLFTIEQIVKIEINGCEIYQSLVVLVRHNSCKRIVASFRL